MKSLDARDYSREPVAVLSPISILKMRAMIRLAIQVGDLPFTVVEAIFRKPSKDWTAKK